MSVTEEIKSRLDIVDVIGDYVPLRKSGSSYTGFCPFHANTRTPAFVVFPNTQSWRCFGACAEGGDVFGFVMKKEGWDFKEALEHLARRAGVTLHQASPAEKAQQAVEERLLGLLDAAADYFHQLLLHAPQAEQARQYVAGRGLKEETVATFRLGFALDSWDACRTYFDSQGYSTDDLSAAGLLTYNEERDTTYDRFRNRFMIPICDVSGRVVGFGARTLEKEGIPKYLNSPQTQLFDKSRLLFGLELARRHIREARQAVIVEGYLDVIQAWQHGFRNVVAQMGTALTGEQLALLKRYTRRFVLALDADAAGASATLRSLDVARQSLDRDADSRFDARGLIHHEGRLKADIRVVTLPEGEDPDSLIRRDPTSWPTLIDRARPVVEYVIDIATAHLDPNDAKAKAAIAQQILPLIGDVADPVERDHYRGKLARALRVDERALRQIGPAAAPRRAAPHATPAPPRRQTAIPHVAGAMPWPKQVQPLERYYLRQCLEYPELLIHIDRKLGEVQQPPVAEQDLSTAEDKALLRYLQQRLNNGNIAGTDELWDSLERPLRERVETLLNTPAIDGSQRDRLPDALALAVLNWRLEKARQRLAEVRQLFQEADQQANPEHLALFQQHLRDLPVEMARLNKAMKAMSALGRRQAEEAAGGS